MPNSRHSGACLETLQSESTPTDDPLKSSKSLISIDFQQFSVVFAKRDAPTVVKLFNMFRNVCLPIFTITRPLVIKILNSQLVILPSANAVAAVEPAQQQRMDLKKFDGRSVQKIELCRKMKIRGRIITIPIATLMICGVGKFRNTLAFVASLSPNNTTRWFGIRFVETENHPANLQKTFLQVLQKHYQVNGILSDKVVLYRDDVSDWIAQSEIELLTLCHEYYNDYCCPALSVALMQKRIPARLLCERSFIVEPRFPHY